MKGKGLLKQNKAYYSSEQAYTLPSTPCMAQSVGGLLLSARPSLPHATFIIVWWTFGLLVSGSVISRKRIFVPIEGAECL